MPASRRESSKSQGSDGPPLKKRKVVDQTTISDDTIPLDPNAIDHNLDLVAPPPVPPAVAAIPDHHATLDSFDLFLDDSELHADPVIHGDAVPEPAVPAQDEEDEEEQRKPAAKKKKASRRNSAQGSVGSGTKESKQPSMNIEAIKKKYGHARLERIRRQAIKDTLKEYQEETNRVVQQLPSEITSMFGQIGFGKFGKKWFPVLIVSPYDVAIEQVRSDWYTTFERALEGKIKFAHLGHWIGEKDYSPLAQTAFVLYDEASKTHRSAVDSVLRKVEKGTPLKPASEETYLQRAMQKVEKLLKMDPEERRRQIPHTRHPFEDLSIDEILHDMMEKNLTVEIVEKDMSDDEEMIDVEA
eukprot:scaffold46132_cov199-Amphora_coffeaeformis.AAC.1